MLETKLHQRVGASLEAKNAALDARAANDGTTEVATRHPESPDQIISKRKRLHEFLYAEFKQFYGITVKKIAEGIVEAFCGIS